MMRLGFQIVLESAFIKIGKHIVELIHIPSNPAPSHFQLHARNVRNIVLMRPIKSMIEFKQIIGRGTSTA